MDFQIRHCESELMDEPELDPDSHRSALTGLQRVNWWSGTAGRLWTSLRKLAAERNLSHLRILDLACGGGDVALALARRAVGGSLAVTLHGWDRSDTAVALANQRATESGIDNVAFFERDVLADPIEEPFDAVICTLFLHHLSDDDAMRLVCRMRDAATHCVLVDDLLRSRMGYCLAWIGTRILSRSPIVHFDGPVSVRAAFCLEEIREMSERAEMSGARIVRHWPQRFLLTWWRS